MYQIKFTTSAFTVKSSVSEVSGRISVKVSSNQTITRHTHCFLSYLQKMYAGKGFKRICDERRAVVPQMFQFHNLFKKAPP